MATLFTRFARACRIQTRFSRAGIPLLLIPVLGSMSPVMETTVSLECKVPSLGHRSWIFVLFIPSFSSFFSCFGDNGVSVSPSLSFQLVTLSMTLLLFAGIWGIITLLDILYRNLEISINYNICMSSASLKRSLDNVY